MNDMGFSKMIRVLFYQKLFNVSPWFQPTPNVLKKLQQKKKKLDGRKVFELIVNFILIVIPNTKIKFVVTVNIQNALNIGYLIIKLYYSINTLILMIMI